MKKVYIQSCHASLEYDEARMLHGMGYKVGGNFDIGSTQRPKITGVTDHNHDIADFSTIILHQVPDYTKVMETFLTQGKNVVLVSFGQIDTWQYAEIGRMCATYPNAWVAAYSKKDYNHHIMHGAPSNKIRMIRFGKYLTDFDPWVGNGGYIYATCNSIHQRGHGCGWQHMQYAMSQIPIKLSGKDTDQVGGLGQIEEEEMRRHYRDAAAFISFGTMPATMVLTQIEAWCAGCPTVIWNNGFGIADEGFRGIITQDVEGMIAECRLILQDEEYRKSRHRDSIWNSDQFDVSNVGHQWNSLLMEVMR